MRDLASPNPSTYSDTQTVEGRHRQGLSLFATNGLKPPDLFPPSWCIQRKDATALAGCEKRWRFRIRAPGDLHYAGFPPASDTQSRLGAFFVFPTTAENLSSPPSHVRCSAGYGCRRSRHPLLRQCGKGNLLPAAMIDRRYRSFLSEIRRRGHDDHVPPSRDLYLVH